MKLRREHFDPRIRFTYMKWSGSTYRGLSVSFRSADRDVITAPGLSLIRLPADRRSTIMMTRTFVDRAADRAFHLKETRQVFCESPTTWLSVSRRGSDLARWRICQQQCFPDIASRYVRPVEGLMGKHNVDSYEPMRLVRPRGGLLLPSNTLIFTNRAVSALLCIGGRAACRDRRRALVSDD